MTLRSIEAVFTGFGGVTGAGDETAFRASWLGGESCVRPFEGRAHEGLPPGYGAPAAFVHKDLRGLPGGRGLRPGTMTAHSFLAAGAVGRALLHAGLEDPESDPDSVAERRGAYIGTYTNFPAMDKHLRLTHKMGSPDAAATGAYEIEDARISGGMRGFTGFDFLKLMNNMPTAHVSIQANVRGPANTFLGHSSVGLQAIGRAWDSLRLDLADQFVTGSSGPGTIEGLCFIRQGQGALADPALDPASAARPLDVEATGLVPGDGAAAFILETAASATHRGARPIARMAGYAEKFAVPLAGRGPLSDASSVIALLQQVLSEAGWSPSDVDYIAGSALGQQDLDRIEADALATVFGVEAASEGLALHTGVVGFTEAAHGTLGLLGALQSMVDGKIAPTVNLTRAVGGLAAMRPRERAVDRDVRRAVVLGLAPEGTMTALAVERA
ncbi:MAG: beta-ketoacyl synthase N-terminal-like domain-containing protein [Myxococcota bacterium]|nr:beta-ketoacyl synthase N-terminal-like domain-containing protein [Myxococcota bacterium]